MGQGCAVAACAPDAGGVQHRSRRFGAGDNKGAYLRLGCAARTRA